VSLVQFLQFISNPSLIPEFADQGRPLLGVDLLISSLVPQCWLIAGLPETLKQTPDNRSKTTKYMVSNVPAEYVHFK
jgi:hypothetical protein